MPDKQTFEFRGVDNLVYAEVVTDTKEKFETGEVKPLSPVATVTKSTDSSSEAHYYDNQPMLVINSEAADEIGITVAPLQLDTYADITGKEFDAASGMLIDCEREPKYFAIGYRTKGTDGKYRYVWRLKGSFAIPEETSETENDGTDTTNMELTFTGIVTTHKFAKNNKPAKGIVVDERFVTVDSTTFFDTVQTPDTWKVTEG